MTIKVSDLAKKIGTTSKEVVAKAKELGIVAKAANSSLSEADAQVIENDFKNRESGVKTSVKEALAEKRPTRNEGVEGETKKKPRGTPMTKKEKDAKDAKMAALAKAKAKAEAKKEEMKSEVDEAKPKKEGVDETEKAKVETKAKTEDKKEEKTPRVVIVAKAEKSEEEKISDEVVKKEDNKKEEAKKEVAKEEKATEKESKSVVEEQAIRRPKVVKKAEDVKKEAEERKLAQKLEREKRKEGSSNQDTEKRDKNNKNTAKTKDNNQRNRNKADRQEEKSNNRPYRKEEVSSVDVGMNSDKRKSKKKDKDKDRDKARDERRSMDGKSKGKLRNENNAYGERSLEKKAKKKKQKVKEVEVVEEATLVPEGVKVINVPITVAGFSEQIGVSVSNIIMALMKLGIVTNINANIDEDTAILLSEELGVEIHIGKVEEEVVEIGIEDFEDKEEDLVGRSPIITVMGHVDHGKTSLLDAIRATNVTASESGGITQHIGASEVTLNGNKIVFLDTPGHEAFTAMRARGANITDIAVLVVAADDSVKPQTIESISHAKAAGVPIIVAINKIDKPGANPDVVKKDLTEHGILVEDWGGDVISVPVSAKTGEGIENLLEMILLQAEVLELKANPKRLALGTVIEARLDKSKGPVATLLVTNGSVKSGQSLVAGNTSGRIRLMTDFKGTTIKKAGPATAVEVLGLTEVPAAGDDFHVVKDDKIAREIADRRKQKQREEVLAKNSSSTLEELFSQIQAGEVKDLNLIVKGDVRGSVGAVVTSLEKLSNDEVRVRIVHSGVGAITESDVSLASTAGAIIIGFNVRPTPVVQGIADRESVQIRTYRVIYNIIDDIESAMKGMLDPEFKEVVLGQLVIRETFKVPGVGTIGGAYVTDGKVVRNAQVRIVRDGIVIHEGKISSLKRFKDDAKEVAQGYECGIGIENYNDIKEEDVVECFQIEEVARG